MVEPGNWADRVRFAGGEKPFAYRPGQFLVRATTDPDLVAAIVPGADSQGECGNFTLFEYHGNALTAVSRLKGAGFDAQPVHVFFLDAGPGNPLSPDGLTANPVYANPVYANPVYANPVYANPVYANPVYANPVYANPVYANPVYANPVYANPVYANPVYANPAYANAGFGLPWACACKVDPCVCRPATSGPAQSYVYPSPTYAEEILGPAGVTYKRTGSRPSLARAASVDHEQIALLTESVELRTISVAVIDTGLPGESGRVGLRNTGQDVASRDIANGVKGDYKDRADDDRDDYLDPVAGHGWFIAGLLTLLCPGVEVTVHHAFSTFGDGNEVDIVRKLVEITRTKPDIISLSFSGYVLDEPKALQEAIQGAQANGILVVASAGNDGISRKAYPAAFPGVVSVAALGPNGPAPFSNWGDWVRACAPGADVLSSFFVWNKDAVEKEYGYDADAFEGWATWTGTSFAAPIVAAALARALAWGMTKQQAIEQTVDAPELLRLPCYGTVINEIPRLRYKGPLDRGPLAIAPLKKAAVKKAAVKKAAVKKAARPRARARKSP